MKNNRKSLLLVFVITSMLVITPMISGKKQLCAQTVTFDAGLRMEFKVEVGMRGDTIVVNNRELFSNVFQRNDLVFSKINSIRVPVVGTDSAAVFLVEDEFSVLVEYAWDTSELEATGEFNSTDFILVPQDTNQLNTTYEKYATFVEANSPRIVVFDEFRILPNGRYQQLRDGIPFGPAFRGEPRDKIKGAKPSKKEKFKEKKRKKPRGTVIPIGDPKGKKK